MVNDVMAATNQDLLMESVHLCDKINLGTLPPTVKSRTKTEATIPVNDGGYVFVFTFGSVAFFNVGKAQQMEFLKALGPAPEDAPTDDFRISVRPEERDKVMFGQVVLPEVSEARLRLVARALAQSTALETVERMVEGLVERSAKMTDVMKLGGRVPGHEKDLIRFIGTALDARRSVLSSLAVLDAPEATWDD
ncbi:MAG TPA: RMD1 family protein, partial [Candidatus Xenobia bacterium]